MAYNRLPIKDPRTIAREIPGICDMLFPQLTAGTVLHYNKTASSFKKIEIISDEIIRQSSLQSAMLFELAYARGEQILKGISKADWEDCLDVATKRQRRHFDAVLPDGLTLADIKAAELVSQNMVYMLNELVEREGDSKLLQSPEILGFQWISSGNGDFSIGPKLIEVKCSARNFGSADYRQILIYWLLSYISSIEFDKPEWNFGILLNPRLNQIVEIEFDELVMVTGAGKSKIEVVELFSSIVGDYGLRALSEFKI